MVLRHEAAHRVDSRTGLVHSAVVTAANVHDKHPLPDLLHGAERASMATAPTPARSRLSSPRRHRLRTSPTSAHAGRPHRRGRVSAKNRTKSQVRARVEHVFGVVKTPGLHKVRYRGSAKNATRRLWRWLWPTSPRAKNTIWTGASIAHDSSHRLAARAGAGLARRNVKSNRTAAPEFHRIRRPARGRYFGWRLAATCSALSLREEQVRRVPVLAVLTRIASGQGDKGPMAILGDGRGGVCDNSLAPPDKWGPTPQEQGCARVIRCGSYEPHHLVRRSRSRARRCCVQYTLGHKAKSRQGDQALAILRTS